MNIDTILGRKGREVVTITESHTVLDAVRLLVERDIGSLVVVEDRRPKGIFTERDVLRLTARSPGELGTLTVGSVMTRDVVTARPHDDLREVMHVMTRRKVRHLPVVDDGRLVGIVSIGDVVNECRRSAEEENSQLRHYIHGGG